MRRIASQSNSMVSKIMIYRNEFWSMYKRTRKIKNRKG
jgi:hypothetical protein